MPFKSVTKVFDDGHAGQAIKAGPPGSQSMNVYIHGSGGWNYTPQGIQYSAVCDETMGYQDNLPFLFNVKDPDTFHALNPSVLLQLLDKLILPNGAISQSLWFGYTLPGESPKAAHPFTLRILPEAIGWMLGRYPQVNPNRVWLSGNSMGGWACVHWGWRHPEIFSCVFATLPRYRMTSLTDLATGNWPNQPSVMMEDGSQTYGQYMDMIAYVSNPANVLPFYSAATGQHDDQYATWPEHLEAIAALRATKRGFVYAWNNGTHSTGYAAESAIKATYKPESFERGKAYPVLMNSSRDDDPTVMVGPGVIGGINLGYKWRSITDGWEITNMNGPATVDVLPSDNVNQAAKPISIPAAGVWVPVTFGGVVVPPTNPAIANFTATPASINAGQSAVLNATVTNAIATTLDGQPVSLPVTVTPAATKDYTLTATGAAGTTPASATATVTVTPVAGDPCQSIKDERDAALAKVAAAVAILTAP